MIGAATLVTASKSPRRPRAQGFPHIPERAVSPAPVLPPGAGFLFRRLFARSGGDLDQRPYRAMGDAEASETTHLQNEKVKRMHSVRARRARTRRLQDRERPRRRPVCRVSPPLRRRSGGRFSVPPLPSRRQACAPSERRQRTSQWEKRAGRDRGQVGGGPSFGASGNIPRYTIGLGSVDAVHHTLPDDNSV